MPPWKRFCDGCHELPLIALMRRHFGAATCRLTFRDRSGTARSPDRPHPTFAVRVACQLNRPAETRWPGGNPTRGRICGSDQATRYAESEGAAIWVTHRRTAAR